VADIGLAKVDATAAAIWGVDSAISVEAFEDPKFRGPITRFCSGFFAVCLLASLFCGPWPLVAWLLTAIGMLATGRVLSGSAKRHRKSTDSHGQHNGRGKSSGM
jgi:hypothetical protein